jgi:hypothetical protein
MSFCAWQNSGWAKEHLQSKYQAADWERECKFRSIFHRPVYFVKMDLVVLSLGIKFCGS